MFYPRGNKNQKRLKQTSKITLMLMASEKPRDPSNALLSSIRSIRCPSVFAKILIPLSFVVTASNEPSLLNLSRGLACEEAAVLSSNSSFLVLM